MMKCHVGPKEPVVARRLSISGIVQGVGFRPFVYQLAHHYELKGEVANTSSGVMIHIEGKEVKIQAFVRDLRQKSPRLALMSYDLDRIHRYAHIEADEEVLLTSLQRPIVLVKKRSPNPLSAEISPHNKNFGVMLPYTPLHYLLLSYDFTALVMTSGNISEEPIVIDNDEAFERLGAIADYFLVHNRDIYLRSHNSIVRRIAGATRSIRRSRGFVPVPVFLKEKVPQILACGAELKNTVCLTKGKNAFISQYIGDLEELETYRFFERTLGHMKRILDIDPQIVACDLHPDYLSTRYAEKQTGIQKIAVQHHHAHIVSCMAENRLDGPVLGLSFDGTGYGTDGSIWDGEVLIAETHQFTRAAHLVCLPMPGGEAAIKEPWRMAISYLYHVFGEAFHDLELPLFRHIEKEKTRIILEMISKGVNSPQTSSLGRLFDGIAAMLGIRNRVAYEGQAAMELEMAIGKETERSYNYEWERGKDSYQILLHPIVRGVVKDMEKGVQVSDISSKFHMTLIRMFSDLCAVLGQETGLDRVVLSGGIFQNATLLAGLKKGLEEKAFHVITHCVVPCNDGGISLGQAVVAAAVAKSLDR